MPHRDCISNRLSLLRTKNATGSLYADVNGDYEKLYKFHRNSTKSLIHCSFTVTYTNILHGNAEFFTSSDRATRRVKTDWMQISRVILFYSNIQGGTIKTGPFLGVDNF